MKNLHESILSSTKAGKYSEHSAKKFLESVEMLYGDPIQNVDIDSVNRTISIWYRERKCMYITNEVLSYIKGYKINFGGCWALFDNCDMSMITIGQSKEVSAIAIINSKLDNLDFLEGRIDNLIIDNCKLNLSQNDIKRVDWQLCIGGNDKHYTSFNSVYAYFVAPFGHALCNQVKSAKEVFKEEFEQCLHFVGNIPPHKYFSIDSEEKKVIKGCVESAINELNNNYKLKLTYKLSFVNYTGKKKFSGVKIKIDPKSCPEEWKLTKMQFNINFTNRYRIDNIINTFYMNMKGSDNDYYSYRGEQDFSAYIRIVIQDIIVSIDNAIRDYNRYSINN